MQSTLRNSEARPNISLLRISNFTGWQIMLPGSFLMFPPRFFRMETSTHSLFNGKLWQVYQMDTIQVENGQNWTLAEVTKTMSYHHEGKNLETGPFWNYLLELFHSFLVLFLVLMLFCPWTLNFKMARTMSDSTFRHPLNSSNSYSSGKCPLNTEGWLCPDPATCPPSICQVRSFWVV